MHKEVKQIVKLNETGNLLFFTYFYMTDVLPICKNNNAIITTFFFTTHWTNTKTIPLIRTKRHKL